MLCCTLASIAGATLARGSHRRALALTVVVLGTGLLVAAHLDHYATRAAAHERDLLAEILAQPICTGAPG